MYPERNSPLFPTEISFNILPAESATFIGHIKETSEEFLFRIYDREYFLYLLKRLRTVKKESAQDITNIKL